MYNGIYKERCFGYNSWPWTFSTTLNEDKNVLLFSNVSSILLLFWYWMMRDVVVLVVVVAAPDVNAFRRLSVPWDFSYSDTWGFFLYISSSLQTPLALILEDDVLDLRFVFEDALTRVLCLLHLDWETFYFGISKMSFVSLTWRQVFNLMLWKSKFEQFWPFW